MKRIIDAHVHLYDEPGYLDDLLRIMDECGIEKSCVSGLGELFGFADNDAVRAAFKSHPDRIIGAVFVRPGVDEPDKINQAFGDGFKMIKVAVPKAGYESRSFSPLWERAMELNMPVLFHTGTVVCKDVSGEHISSWNMHPMRIEPITREFPELKIIIAHLGVHWNTDAAELARMHPNVYVDLTGEPDGWRLRADAVGMDKWLWWAGAFEKVIFGTDVHYSKIEQILHEDIKRFDGLDVSVETQEKIFSGSIVRLLGIE